jgi:hypothetical protein
LTRENLLVQELITKAIIIAEVDRLDFHIVDITGRGSNAVATETFTGSENNTSCGNNTHGNTKVFRSMVGAMVKGYTRNTVCRYCNVKTRKDVMLCLPCKGLSDKGIIINHEGYYMKPENVSKYVKEMNKPHDGKSVVNDPNWKFLSFKESHDGFVKTTVFMYSSDDGKKIRKEVFQDNILIETTLS